MENTKITLSKDSDKLMNNREFISSYDVVKYVEVDGGKSSMCDMTGSVAWIRDGYEEDDDSTIYGTPNWENDEGITPFDNIDGVHHDDIKLYGSKMEQLIQYNNTLIKIIKKIEKS